MIYAFDIEDRSAKKKTMPYGIESLSFCLIGFHSHPHLLDEHINQTEFGHRNMYPNDSRIIPVSIDLCYAMLGQSCHRFISRFWNDLKISNWIFFFVQILNLRLDERQKIKTFNVNSVMVIILSIGVDRKSQIEFFSRNHCPKRKGINPISITSAMKDYKFD